MTLAEEGTIRVLDRATIDRIAAGEVIERPAAVVKELVENAIDAGAHRVDIELEDYGAVIKVTDDGCGMTADDARRSFLRHSTSKLRTPDDLFAIGTLGFRGEALSSIASVARVELVTRPNPDARPRRVGASDESWEGGDTGVRKEGGGAGIGKERGDAGVRKEGGGGGIGKEEEGTGHGNEREDEGGSGGPPGSDAGFRVVVEGGEVVEAGEAGAAPGTRIVVRDLFFNTPVRKKFLRSRNTELTHMVDAVTSLALAHPRVGIFLRSDGNELLVSPPVTDPLANITNIYGSSFARSLVQADHADENITIRGYVSKPQLTRGRTDHQHFVVNGRRVRSAALSRGLREGYGPLLMKGRNPVCFLDIRMMLSQVDVNVHPAKREVRFRSEPVLVRVLRVAVRAALEDADIIPRLDGGEGEGVPGIRARGAGRILLDHTLDVASALSPMKPACEGGAAEHRSGSPGEALTGVRGNLEAPAGSEVAGVQLSLDVGAGPAGTACSPGAVGGIGEEVRGAPDPHTPGPDARTLGEGYPMTPGQHARMVAQGRTALPFMRAVGQLHDCYIVAQTAEGFALIDQHAAHERVNLDRLKRQLAGGKPPSQALLEPVVVELPPATVRALEERMEALRAVGFSLEPFGAGAVKVEGVPALLRGRLDTSDMPGLLEELASSPLEQGGGGAGEVGMGAGGGREPVVGEEVLHSIACRASIMQGDPLDIEGMARLIREMYEADEPLSCAHGRPTLLFMELGELEKRFKRA